MRLLHNRVRAAYQAGRHLKEFSFFDPEALGTRVEHIHLGDFLRPARQDGLAALMSEIVRKTLDEEAAIVVVDSAKMLRDFADERELRGALYDLTGRICAPNSVCMRPPGLSSLLDRAYAGLPLYCLFSRSGQALCGSACGCRCWDEAELPWLAGSLATAPGLAVLILIAGPAGGAHFNPLSQ